MLNRELRLRHLVFDLACAGGWRYSSWMARTRGDLHCPRCGVPLASKRATREAFAACSRCGGVWIGREQVEQLARRFAVDVAPLEATGERTCMASPPPASCPVCKGSLITVSVQGALEIQAELCVEHGAWLDRRCVRLLARAAGGAAPRRSRRGRPRSPDGDGASRRAGRRVADAGQRAAEPRDPVADIATEAAAILASTGVDLTGIVGEFGATAGDAVDDLADTALSIFAGLFRPR